MIDQPTQARALSTGRKPIEHAFAGVVRSLAVFSLPRRWSKSVGSGKRRRLVAVVPLLFVNRAITAGGDDVYTCQQIGTVARRRLFTTSKRSGRECIVWNAVRTAGGGGGTLKNCTRVGQVRRRTCGLFISDPRWLHSGAIASPPEETRDKQTLDVDADITYIIIYTRLYCSLGSSRVALRAQVTWRKVVFPDNPFFEINNNIVQWTRHKIHLIQSEKNLNNILIYAF